jgi:hypothetical protein
VGFFASLFGQNKTPAPRPAALSRSTGAARAEHTTAGTPSQPVEANSATQPDPTPSHSTGPLPRPLSPRCSPPPRAHLDNKDLPAALQLYEQIAAADIDLAEPLTRISGDLGATGHIDALIEFLSPRYSPELHGLQPGINLLQAFLHRRNPGAAQQLLDLLIRSSPPTRCAIASTVFAAPSKSFAPSSGRAASRSGRRRNEHQPDQHQQAHLDLRPARRREPPPN